MQKKTNSILVFAYSQVGYRCLKKLIDLKYNVVCVFTHQDDQTKENIWFDSVQDLACQYSIPYFFDKPSEQIDLIKSFAPDVILSTYYRSLIPEEVLKIAKIGAFNLHGSLLPKYRGKCPINWAIINGETQTGATLHHMVARADAGDIVDQEKFSIGIDETAGEILGKLIKAGETILERSLPNILDRKIFPIKQNLGDGCYYGGRSEKDSQIDWNKSAFEIHNLVRALQPYPNYPCAFSFFNGHKIFIKKTSYLFEKSDNDYSIGQVIEVANTFFKISCGDGNVIKVLDWFFVNENIILKPNVFFAS